jgi:hypothetical protein
VQQGIHELIIHEFGSLSDATAAATVCAMQQRGDGKTVPLPLMAWREQDEDTVEEYIMHKTYFWWFVV